MPPLLTTQVGISDDNRHVLVQVLSDHTYARAHLGSLRIAYNTVRLPTSCPAREFAFRFRKEPSVRHCRNFTGVATLAVLLPPVGE